MAALNPRSDGPLVALQHGEPRHLDREESDLPLFLAGHRDRSRETQTPARDGHDEVEVLALVEAALCWDVDSPELPAVTNALVMAQHFTDYGRFVADDLEAQLLSLPTDSELCVGVRATLGEASRPLYVRPLAQTAAPRSAAHRAQNLACLVRTLD